MRQINILDFGRGRPQKQCLNIIEDPEVNVNSFPLIIKKKSRKTKWYRNTLRPIIHGNSIVQQAGFCLYTVTHYHQRKFLGKRMSFLLSHQGATENGKQKGTDR